MSKRTRGYDHEGSHPSLPRGRLPDEGFVRLNTILSVIPIGRSTWWQGVASGRYPRPVKLLGRVTAWRAEDIRQLIDNVSEVAATHDGR